jgi:hypothetical protein
MALLVASGIVVSEKIPGRTESPAAPTFYRDVLPILQQHCQRCHRAAEIAPMPLVTYEDVKPWARQMAKDTRSKRMPPWFADPCCGHFADDPSLTDAQIATLSAWAETKAPGDPHDAPPSPHRTEGWNISPPDVILKMPKAVAIPAVGDIEYTYEIVPTDFKEDKWIQIGDPPVQPPIRSPRRGVHSAAGFEVVARRVPEHAIHRFQPERSGSSASSPRNDQRSFARIRAGQFSRSLARRHGQIHSRSFGSRLSDALHDEGTGGQ